MPKGKALKNWEDKIDGADLPPPRSTRPCGR